jgi:glycosyltransferase involved in cell wall biosynthesis
MRIGVFHPALNVCGGAEWVAFNIIDCLKTANHSVIALTNERIDQNRIKKLFGHEAGVDAQLILPLELFPTTDIHNVYTDFIRTWALKQKCDVLIDTYSNAILPNADLTYIHFPILGRIPKSEKKGGSSRRLKNLYYHPYLYYEKRKARKGGHLILANSKYTMNAIKKMTQATSTLLYPPISKTFFSNDFKMKRRDIVVSVDRISPEKRLTVIPEIARLTSKKIHFLIVGIKESLETLRLIRESIRRNGVDDRVEINTNVPRDKLQDLLRTSKVFLHPAIGEHFGVSTVEAMASGCIPVVHNSGGPIEFVPSSLRFDNLEEAANKLEKAVFEWSPQKSEEVARSARPFSEEQFRARFWEEFDHFLKNQQKTVK